MKKIIVGVLTLTRDVMVCHGVSWCVIELKGRKEGRKGKITISPHIIRDYNLYYCGNTHYIDVFMNQFH